MRDGRAPTAWVRWLGLLVSATLLGGAASGQDAQPRPPTPEKQAKINLGLEHATARALYDYFKEQAGGGQMLSWEDAPDWTGVWTREGQLFFWDQDQASFDALPTAKLTPEYARRLREKLANIEKGVEYDPLSAGNPAGMPRWMTEPFLRDFAVTPKETWLITEQMNEVRRVYTDGRDHPAPEDAYPQWEGDSIGFWDGDRLIIHTNSMHAGQYQRLQPSYSDQVETVEIWQKTADDTLEVDIWVYDPPSLIEPWYAKQTYKKLSNPDKSLRIRYWDFSENQNNDVTLTKDGSSQFTDFSFD